MSKYFSEKGKLRTSGRLERLSRDHIPCLFPQEGLKNQGLSQHKITKPGDQARGVRFKKQKEERAKGTSQTQTLVVHWKGGPRELWIPSKFTHRTG